MQNIIAPTEPPLKLQQIKSYYTQCNMKWWVLLFEQKIDKTLIETEHA